MADTQTSARTRPLRTSEVTTIASPRYSVQEAAVCPDGKLEVGGAASSCTTSGRFLLTTVTVRRNRLNSSVSAKSRKPNCRQWRRRTSTMPVTTETVRMTPVDPRSEAHA